MGGGNEIGIFLTIDYQRLWTFDQDLQQKSGHMPIGGENIGEHGVLSVFLIHTFDQVPEAKRIHFLFTGHGQSRSLLTPYGELSRF